MIETIVTSSVLIVVLVILRRIWKGKISLRLQYALWLLVAIRLLVPLPVVETAWSVMNVMTPVVEKTEAFGNREIDIPTRLADGQGVQTVPENPAQIQESGEGVPGIQTPSTVTPVVPKNPQKSENFEQVGVSDSQIETQSFTWKKAVNLMWYAGIVVMALWFGGCNLVFRRKLYKNRELLGQEGRVKIYVTDSVSSPCLCGFFFPAIYLTQESLADEEVRTHVLAHEMTHYRHGDSIWTLVRCICVIVYWFNPLVWLASHLSTRDSELACDEGTLARLGECERVAYGETLITMVAEVPKASDILRCSTSMAYSKKEIKERIRMIAGKPNMLKRMAIIVLCCTLVLTACTFGTANGTNPIEETEPIGETEPEETEPVVDNTLTAEEIAWFNENFFNQQESRVTNGCLTSLYAVPEDIDLHDLFYHGTYGEDSIEEPLTEEERDFLKSKNLDPNLDTVRFTREGMDKILQRYMGITLEESNLVGWDELIFNGWNCYYYHCVGDTNLPHIKVLRGYRTEEGNVVLYYIEDLYSIREGQEYQVTLKALQNGYYQFLSNMVLVDGYLYAEDFYPMKYLSEYKADFTGNGLEESVYIYGYSDPNTEYGEDCFGKIRIYQTEPQSNYRKELFEYDGVGTAPANIGGVAVCSYYGRPCLLLYGNSIGQQNHYWYQLIGLRKDGTKEILQEQTVAYRNVVASMPEEPIQILAEKEMYPETVRSELKEVEQYLNEVLQGRDTRILLNTSLYKEYCYYYAPKATLYPLMHYNGFDVFAAGAYSPESVAGTEFPRNGSIDSYLDRWRTTTEDCMRKYEEEISQEWEQIEPEILKIITGYRELNTLMFHGLEAAGEAEVLPFDLEYYYPVTDPRYQSTKDIEKKIQSICSGEEAELWKHWLLDDFYVDYDGRLWNAEVDYISDNSPCLPILGFAKVSDDRWIVTTGGGYDVNLVPVAVEIGVVKEGGEWKVEYCSRERVLYMDEVGIKPYTTWR